MEEENLTSQESTMNSNIIDLSKQDEPVIVTPMDVLIENQKLIAEALTALANIIDNQKFHINTLNEERKIKNQINVIKNRANHITKNLKHIIKS